MLADVLGAWDVEAQQVAAIIGHDLIVTRVVLRSEGGDVDPAAADTKRAGRHPGVSPP
jgi:hypothetical protein